MDSERKKVWTDRAWSLFQALVLLFAGALLGQSLDYWRTFSFIASDIRGYVLSPAILSENVDIELAFVNKGNRRGAITEIQPVFPLEFNQMPSARSYLSQRVKDFSTVGIPVVLNPGDIRLITLKGKLNPETIASNAKLVDPKGDDFDSSKPDMRKQDIVIRLHALDFRGRKYETFWPLGTLYILNKKIDTHRMPAPTVEMHAFDQSGYSPNAWLNASAIEDEIDAETRARISPSPSLSQTAPH